MKTKEIMDIALDLAEIDYQPEDSTIIVEGDNINKVLIGVDMDTPELLLAKELGYDCVISHHPMAGSSITNFTKVMDSQIDRMVEFGVPINRAQKVLKKKLGEVDRGMHVRNYDRTASAARLMKMPYLNIHQPADFITEAIVQNHLDERLADNPKAKLSDVVEALMEMDEYKNTLAGPKIRVGADDDYAGRIAVLMAGGTGGGPDVYKAYFDAGVGTIIAMHMPEDVKKAVEEQNIGNVVVAGHMASDSIGLNVIINKLIEMGLEVDKMSGIV